MEMKMENGTQETEYVSQSTIDREPRMPKEDEKQQKIFDEEEHEAKTQEYLANHGPDQVAYKLTLVIDGNGFQNTVKFGGEKIPADQFEEMILKRLKGEYFLQQIRGICGEQLPTKDKQEELFESNPLLREAQAAMNGETGGQEAEDSQEAADSTEDSQTAEPETEAAAKPKLKAVKKRSGKSKGEGEAAGEPEPTKENDPSDPSTWL